MMKKGLAIHLTLVAIVSVVAYSGLLMGHDLGPNLPLIDKVEHFLFVGGIAFWWTAGWNDPQLRIAGREIPLVLVTLLILGTAEEAFQSLSPYRDPEIFDWLANVAGVITFWWLGRRHRPVEPIAS